MNCPFQDPQKTSLCLVLQANGDRSPECVEMSVAGSGDKKYRNCRYYGPVMFGDLWKVFRCARREVDGEKNLLVSAV